MKTYVYVYHEKWELGFLSNHKNVVHKYVETKKKQVENMLQQWHKANLDYGINIVIQELGRALTLFFVDLKWGD